jgi:hypothetical protein
MYSIRKESKRGMLEFVILAMLASAGGCAIKQSPPPDSVSHTPLVVDEAMQQRQWPISVAHYANGAAVGEPTTFLLTHRADEPVWTAALTDTPMFVANSIASPAVLICSPPWARVIYPSGGVEASYNAMPALRGEK